MESVTKKRVIVYSSLLILFIIFILVGRNKYYNGFGNYGKIRQKLIPISNKFNTIDYIIRYGGLNSTVSRDKITFTYETEDVKETITCKYNKDEKFELLKCDIDSKLYSSQIVTKGIIDTIFMINGNKDTIFKEYELDEFTKLNMTNGFEYTKSNKNKLTIDINTKIYSKLNELGLNQIEVPTIEKKDIEPIFDVLFVEHKATITKNTKTIYIVDNENNFTLYCQDTNRTDKNNYTKSILNVILELNTEVYESINSSTDKFDKDVSTDTYEILRDVGNNTLEDVFKSRDNITKIVIAK